MCTCSSCEGLRRTTAASLAAAGAGADDAGAAERLCVRSRRVRVTAGEREQAQEDEVDGVLADHGITSLLTVSESRAWARR